MYLWDLGKTPIIVDQLKILLDKYPNPKVAEELCSGFTYGFRLQYVGPRDHVYSTNLISAEQHGEETLKKINSEIELGRILGPFTSLPIATLRISPIGLVLKPDGGWRLITILSHPVDNSVNSAIDPEFCKVTYTSFDSILHKIYV